MAKASAIIVAAGSSTRMGSDKILLPLCGVPVLCHTMRVFEMCGQIGEIIVVVRGQNIDAVKEIGRMYNITKLRHIVEGGATRSQSVANGVSACDETMPLLCIHDGARPFVTNEMILDALNHAEKTGCATAAVTLKDTVKFVKDGLVEWI